MSGSCVQIEIKEGNIQGWAANWLFNVLRLQETPFSINLSISDPLDLFEVLKKVKRAAQTFPKAVDGPAGHS